MDLYDHAYTYATHDKGSQVEFIFKLGPKETEEFVKLRVTNATLFSGKRNTAKWAWRAILKHMGLHHKMTHVQASKKWDNLKKKYKDLKFPPPGVKVSPELWPYFALMDDAMEGRLAGSAAVLKPLTNNQDACDFLPIVKAKKKKVSEMSSAVSGPMLTDGAEIEVSLNGHEEEEEEEEEAEEVMVALGGRQEMDGMMEEVEDERGSMEGERQLMAKERQLMERERQVLQRERAALDRETAALDRDRAALDRDRASLERERAVMEREKAVMERERATLLTDREALNKERAVLGRERSFLEKSRASNEGGASEVSGETMDSRVVDRKERFLQFFERLIENL